jgi:hypothetical protein
MLEMSVSTLFGSLHLDRTDAGRVDQPEGKVAIDLLVCRIDRCPAPEVSIQPSIQDGTSISPATPQVDPDLPSPEHASPVVSNTPHGEGLPLSQSDEELLSQETQVEEEIRGEYRWLCALLAENEERAWGTAYRDFIGVRLLLSAAQGMGMEELSNNRIGNGAFRASTGEFTLSIWDFIDILGLKHSSNTWRNKVTAYFRVKQLFMFARYRGAAMPFQNPEHTQAWNVIRVWMEHQDAIIQDNEWVTRRYGSKELRGLLQGMVEEACHGKYISLCQCHHTQC